MVQSSFWRPVLVTDRRAIVRALEDYRHWHGLTWDQLAAELHTTASTLHRWRTGDAPPRPIILYFAPPLADGDISDPGEASVCDD